MASLIKHEALYRESSMEFLQRMRQLLYMDKASLEAEADFCEERIKLINKIIDERNEEPLPDISSDREHEVVIGPMR